MPPTNELLLFCAAVPVVEPPTLPRLPASAYDEALAAPDCVAPKTPAPTTLADVPPPDEDEELV
ncbi:hypothetical protein [Caballeronia choica]|uniref:hypothetical protein n=1 Tax=Caballeronia choica TaxID=326476 RepID=UPI001358FE41|nr:hypothetical protein [Caballeronia choica]